MPRTISAVRLMSLAPILLAQLCAGRALAQPYAYVAKIGSDRVSVIDTSTNALLTSIGVGQDPDGVASTPDGTAVYVASFLSDTVSAIDTQTNTVTATVPVGSGPVGVALTPDGQFAYVTNRGSNSVSVIRTTSKEVVATIGVGPGPNSVAITPDGALGYVTNSFSRSPGMVSVIDTATQAVAATVEVARSPNRVAIAPNGRTAYVTNFRSWNVSVIDTATNSVTTGIRVSGRPSGIAVNPNGAFAYVTTLDGEVDIIDTASNQVTSAVSVGSNPYGIAITRTGGSAYVANFLSGTVSVVDLLAPAETAAITVGDKPFAVALSCVGSDCTEPAFTPIPTRTARPTSTPQATPSRTTTPRPTQTLPPAASVDVGSASGRPGEQVALAVSLHAPGQDVGGIQNDLTFAPGLTVSAKANGKPDCAVNPAINKNSTGFSFQPSGCTLSSSCTGIRALVFSFESTDPIPDGAVLYTCKVRIAPDANSGAHVVQISLVGASSPAGFALSTAGTDGEIVVVTASSQRGISFAPPASSTSGGCQAVEPADAHYGWLLLLPAAIVLGRVRRWP